MISVHVIRFLKLCKAEIMPCISQHSPYSASDLLDAQCLCWFIRNSRKESKHLSERTPQLPFGFEDLLLRLSMKALPLVRDKVLERVRCRNDLRLPENDAENSVAMETCLIWWFPLLKDGETPGEWQTVLWVLRQQRTYQANVYAHLHLFLCRGSFISSSTHNTVFAKSFQNVPSSWFDLVICETLPMHSRQTALTAAAEHRWWKQVLLRPALWPGEGKPSVCRCYKLDFLD